jgi:phage terminase large subunit
VNYQVLGADTTPAAMTDADFSAIAGGVAQAGEAGLIIYNTYQQQKEISETTTSETRRLRALREMAQLAQQGAELLRSQRQSGAGNLTANIQKYGKWAALIGTAGILVYSMVN